jgi:glycosyltransferase involved in cell wall biosynthesis
VRVLHVITDLDVGGAENMLHALLAASDPGLSHAVVSLMAPGPVAARIERLGVPVHALGIRRDRPDPRRLLALAAHLRASRPDVIQTWMYHADLLGGLAGRLATRAPVVWGIHNLSLDAATTRGTTRAIVSACARLSRLVPARIVCVSRAARDVHVAAGYAAERFEVIPNGFDLGRFRPDAAARAEVRAEVGVPDGALLIGHLARVAPPKDPVTFLRAAGRVAPRLPSARFLLAGEGATAESPALARAIEEARLGDRVQLLGRRDDVPRLLNALDVSTLSSSGEAFPLVVGEAMACGVPCVASDVGDSAFLLGDTGQTFPPGDADALAARWEALAGLGPEGRRRLGAAARRRIEARFALPRIAAAYAYLYRRILGVDGPERLARAVP